MTTKLTREQGLELLKKYNKEPFHILHGLTVEGTIKWFAKELGYKKIELIDGRTPGTRDHAPDGFTGHCWVRIDNRYYDPEADWAGWMTGVYGYSSYPIRHYVKKVYNFMR